MCGIANTLRQAFRTVQRRGSSACSYAPDLLAELLNFSVIVDFYDAI